MSQSSNKNIVIFRNSLLPASETFIYEQARAIKAYNVHFVGRDLVNPELTKLNVHVISERKGFKKLQRLWYTISGRSSKLQSAIQNISPVLVHAHFGVDGLYALRFTERQGLPLITTFHGFDATVTFGSLIFAKKVAWMRFALLKDKLKENGTIFIAVSKFIASKLLVNGFPKEKIVVHYIGVDLSMLDINGCFDGGKTILTVGRLVEKKGIEYLIRAMYEIKKKVPDVELKIVGEGPLMQYLTSLVRDLGLEDNVTFLGVMKHSDVLQVMKESTLFCLPSITATNGDAEGLGMVFLEASALKKPVVGTHSGGIPEAIADGESGFLVPEKDVSTLTERILQLLQNPDLRRRMGECGRRLVEEKFDLAKQTRKLEEIYESVLRKRQQ